MIVQRDVERVTTSMPSVDLGDACRQRTLRAGDLDAAQPAGADVGEPVEVAQRRDVDAVLAGDVEDRLAGGAGDVDAVDAQRVDGHRAADVDIVHTPGRAGAVVDVGEVLVAEEPQRAEHRVRRALPEAAQARLGDHLGEVARVDPGRRGLPRRGRSVSSRACSWTVPTRHGTHLPHDSSRQKPMKYLATSTMHEVLSMTIMPPEPMIEPTSASDS